MVQHRFAIVEMATLQAARAFFIEAIGEAWEKVTRGDPCSLQQRARVMSAAHVLQRAAVAAVDAVLPLAGARALYTTITQFSGARATFSAPSQHILLSDAEGRARGHPAHRLEDDAGSTKV